MASLHHLPADQRAVLELVLQRGRNYDQIATLLSVDRAGVRQRALSAFDALAPDSDIPPVERGLIADYLLGQLPPRVAETVHDRLATSPAERAWARILASELNEIATDPLPEIPVGGPVPATSPQETEPAAASEPEPAVAAQATPEQTGELRSPEGRRSSRVGGAVVLGLGAAVVLGIIAVLIFVVFAGSGTKHSNSRTTAARTTTGSTTSTAQAKAVAQVNLFPPTGAGKARGVAQVVDVGSTRGIVLVAQNIPPNKNNFYAVWLYNSPKDYEIVGYVNPGVGSNGQLQTTGALPTNASKYGQLVVALQTKSQPKPPGPVVLQGKLTLKQ